MGIEQIKAKWAQARAQESAFMPGNFDGGGSEDESLAMSMLVGDAPKAQAPDVSKYRDAMVESLGYIDSQDMPEPPEMDRAQQAMMSQYSRGGGGAVGGGGTQGYEGYRSNVYTDTTGNATVGFGHKLTPSEIKSGIYRNGITKEQGQALFQQDKAKHNAQLYKREPWIAKLSGSQQEALQDMAFNMGPAFLDKFSGAKNDLMRGNFRAAASSFANSKYAQQVGKRAQDNAARLLG